MDCRCCSSILLPLDGDNEPYFTSNDLSVAFRAVRRVCWGVLGNAPLKMFPDLNMCFFRRLE